MINLLTITESLIPDRRWNPCSSTDILGSLQEVETRERFDLLTAARLLSTRLERVTPRQLYLRRIGCLMRINNTKYMYFNIGAKLSRRLIRFQQCCWGKTTAIWWWYCCSHSRLTSPASGWSQHVGQGRPVVMILLLRFADILLPN